MLERARHHCGGIPYDRVLGMDPISSYLKAVVRRALPHPVYRLVRGRTLSWRIRRYQDWRRTGVYGGHHLTLCINDSLAEGWYGQDSELPVEIDLLRREGRLRPGATVFNLGAHQAVIALIMAG